MSKIKDNIDEDGNDKGSVTRKVLALAMSEELGFSIKESKQAVDFIVDELIGHIISRNVIRLRGLMLIKPIIRKPKRMKHRFTNEFYTTPVYKTMKVCLSPDIRNQLKTESEGI